MGDDVITRALKRMDAQPPEAYLRQAARLLAIANDYAETRLASLTTPGQPPPGWFAQFCVQLAQANADMAHRIHEHTQYLDWRNG
jgi:hypothetical protein